MKKSDVDIKAILKKLSFLKNNLALLVPIIIAVVSLLLFIPTSILGGKLRDTVQQKSVRTGQRIETLTRDVNEAVAAEANAGYITTLARDANEIKDRILNATRRELLKYDIFPDTNDSSSFLFEQFGQRYLAGVKALRAGMNAGEPPAVEEIQDALKSAPQSPYSVGGGMMDYAQPMMPGMSGRGPSLSTYGMTDVQRKIVDEICRGQARSMGVYANTADLAGCTYWDEWKFETRDAAYRDCWYWQLGYWVLEDVTATVRKMNEGASSVLDAPVKRVMGVAFTLKQMRGAIRRRAGRGRGFARKGEGENPTYVFDDKTGLTKPCTGRLSNEQIDVIHFDVRVVVRAGDIMAFIDELCRAKEHTFRGYPYGNEPPQTFRHNQITVLESSIAPVDREGFQHSLYRYGNGAVVELDLICEYVFNKVAYDSIQPQQVKDDLLGADDTGR